MAAVVFDGKALVAKRQAILARNIRDWKLNPRLGSVVFVEDEGSMLYIKLKKEAAVKVGVEFSVQEVSIREAVPVLQEKIRVYNDRDDVDGVLVQKPAKSTWKQVMGVGGESEFEAWWRMTVSTLDPTMDVDCLTLTNLNAVYNGDFVILPATVRAVVTILQHVVSDLGLLEGVASQFDLTGHKMVVIGRSDIVGKPLASVLAQYGAEVSIYGADLDLEVLKQAEVVVSATGSPGMVKGEMIKEGAIVIDVGAPKGDVDFETVKGKASFVTPVPGGVGPMTVVSLLENLVDLMVANKNNPTI